MKRRTKSKVRSEKQKGINSKNQKGINKNKIKAKAIKRLGEKNSIYTIANKDTIFSEIDNCLGQTSPPDIEFLLCDSNITGIATNLFGRFGHALVRYTLSNGTQRIMNISGVPGTTMVNLVDPTEYMFGTKGWDSWAEQGGLYTRAYWGLRIERCPSGTIEALNHYYEALVSKENIQWEGEEGATGAKFSLTCSRLTTFWNMFNPFGDGYTSIR